MSRVTFHSKSTSLGCGPGGGPPPPPPLGMNVMSVIGPLPATVTVTVTLVRAPDGSEAVTVRMCSGWLARSKTAPTATLICAVCNSISNNAPPPESL